MSMAVKECDGKEGWTGNEHVNTANVSVTINTSIHNPWEGRKTGEKRAAKEWMKHIITSPISLTINTLDLYVHDIKVAAKA